ncbi:MAG: hypothetical protein LBS02_07765 [Hungatella sp.]|nr:hypothetical protein [Hungatella sp.]
MAREKKPLHKVQMTEDKRSIIISYWKNIQDVYKDLLGGTIKEFSTIQNLRLEMVDYEGFG